MKRYVIHRHAARRLHYDLRLEYEGVLKIWAVPKGVPDNAGEKRLAVEVPDHPFDYIGFTGVTPEGEYGAGDVEIWDNGRYELESWGEDKVVVSLMGRIINPLNLCRHP